MTGQELREWRERVKRTQSQVAEKFGVTRTTVQNWESGATPIPQAVDMSCELWEPRLKQEDPNIGPVTLVYSDGPMFIDPYGPRGRLAMMHQEPYPTNTSALARVQALWGRDDFHNPFILEKTGRPLWNVVELGRVADGSDTGAPTLVNLLRAIAENVRDNSTNFVRGSRALNPSELKERQQAIEGQAAELEELATAGFQEILGNQQRIEAVFSNLRALGTKAPDSLVSNVAQAFVVFERKETQMAPLRNLNNREYVVDYRGYEITWPEVRMESSRWTVNLSSSSPHLLATLGGRARVFNDPHSLESAIQRAKLHVDEMLAGAR